MSPALCIAVARAKASSTSLDLVCPNVDSATAQIAQARSINSDRHFLFTIKCFQKTGQQLRKVYNTGVFEYQSNQPWTSHWCLFGFVLKRNILRLSTSSSRRVAVRS